MNEEKQDQQDQNVKIKSWIELKAFEKGGWGSVNGGHSNILKRVLPQECIKKVYFNGSLWRGETYFYYKSPYETIGIKDLVASMERCFIYPELLGVQRIDTKSAALRAIMALSEMERAMIFLLEKKF